MQETGVNNVVTLKVGVMRVRDGVFNKHSSVAHNSETREIDITRQGSRGEK